MPRLSVVIPVLDEEELLGGCLRSVLAEGPSEILVVDGGSQDKTEEVARSFPGVRFLASPPGRALQMNRGATAALGDHFLFLHADCRLPAGARAEIETILAQPEVQLGAFRFAVDSPRPSFRLLERSVAVRSQALKTPYGDQGLFCRGRDFAAVGGFPDVSVMEDLYLVRALRKRGRVEISDLPLVSSSRSWETRGMLQFSARNWALVAADWIGWRPPSCTQAFGDPKAD